MAHDLSPQRPNRHHRKALPDPIRASPHSKLAGCGPHSSYRHLHHQRGTIGNFHVRLLEGKGLARKHWSALSLGPVKHLGLSRAHGEVSSFGSFRLAFWRDGDGHDVVDCVTEVKGNHDGDAKDEPFAASAAKKTASSLTSSSSGVPNMSSTQSQFQSANSSQHAAFMPSMPTPSSQSPNAAFDSGKSPLTPLFDQGCIRTFSPAISHAVSQQQSNNQHQPPMPGSTSFNNEGARKPPSISHPSKPTRQDLKIPATESKTTTPDMIGPSPPHHYANEKFESSTVHNDSNPIWGDAHSFLDNNRGNSSHSNEDRSTFHIPLQKDDLLPALHADSGRISLEVRLDEEMAPTESLLVGGALSTAVGAAAAATSVVPGMGKHAQGVSDMGMEMLGLGTNRLIGRGYVDLMPLLLGLWEESWEQGADTKEEGTADDDATVDEYGRIDPAKHRARRRVERMGMLDVWVPLYHPTANNKDNKKGGDDDNNPETSGKVHLLISYEPNGLSPKRDDVVAFESFARCPVANNYGPTSSANAGPIINPVVPPLSPLIVVESHGGGYLLLEYPVTRTVTSVDRTGNVKSSRWERFHRVRIRRSAVFVIERRTLADAVGSVARMPGDVVMSTPIGREVAEASAPIVAGAMELIGPALLWGKLMMAAGGTGVRAGLAGARLATEAVVTASVEKALENRESSGGDGYGEHAGDAGVYSGYGG